MRRQIVVFIASFALVPTVASIPFTTVAAHVAPIDQSVLRNLNCTLRMTTDHVSDTIMMQDVTQTAVECRNLCAAYAQSSLLSMRDSLHVLRYTCSYRDRIVDRRSLK